MGLVFVFVIGYIIGWGHAHRTVATECQRLGKFYVGSTTYECTAVTSVMGNGEWGMGNGEWEMSRTTRRKRPDWDLGPQSYRQYKTGRVRDGTPQYAAGSCNNRGGCPYCEGNRLFGNKKREPIVLQPHQDS